MLVFDFLGWILKRYACDVCSKSHTSVSLLQCRTLIACTSPLALTGWLISGATFYKFFLKLSTNLITNLKKIEECSTNKDDNLSHGPTAHTTVLMPEHP